MIKAPIFKSKSVEEHVYDPVFKTKLTECVCYIKKHHLRHYVF